MIAPRGLGRRAQALQRASREESRRRDPHQAGEHEGEREAAVPTTQPIARRGETRHRERGADQGGGQARDDA
ncbi:MAG: hypothetical protein RIF41_30545, partial [Polyangiaceae bacterium]